MRERERRKNLVPRSSRGKSDTFLHTHHVPQRLVSLLPIILSSMSVSRNFWVVFKGNMPPKWTHHLVLSDRQVCKWCGPMERTRGRRSWAQSQGEKPDLLISRPVLFFLIPLIGEVNSFYHEEKLSECQIRGLVSPMTNIKNHSYNLPVKRGRVFISKLLMSLSRYFGMTQSLLTK